MLTQASAALVVGKMNTVLHHLFSDVNRLILLSAPFYFVYHLYLYVNHLHLTEVFATFILDCCFHW